MSARPGRRVNARSSTPGKPGPVGDINATVRAKQAFLMALAGHSYPAIATACGFKDRSGAYRAVQRELARYRAPEIDEARSLELQRLDMLLQTWLPRAMGKHADRSAAEVVLKVSARRSALLGLDFAAQERQAADAQRMYLVSVPDALINDPLPPMPNGVPQPRPGDSVMVIPQSVYDAIG